MSATKHINPEHNGIEISFPDNERPDEATRSALKDLGFRWHFQKKVWFAKRTPEREALADRLTGAAHTAAAVKEGTAKPTGRKEARGKAPKEPPLPNTFAASYDSIGDAKILDSADVEILSLYEAYFRDENVRFRRTYSGDCIVVSDLKDAGRAGKTCSIWRLNPAEWNGNVTMSLHNEEGIRTCEELIDALRSGREMSSLKIYASEEKGVEVFSPFVETKPLQNIPERWNKRNFTNAFLAGQIFQGRVDQRLTDDYAMDAARNFMEGVPINIPSAARSMVEDWSSLAYVRTGQEVKPGIVELSYYDGYSTSKTFLLDLNCNIREGKRREEERAEGIRGYNQMLERSCINVKQSDIDPGRIYTITTLDKCTNSGVYNAKEETLQGHVLRERLDPDRLYMDILRVQEMTIEPSKLYMVADFFRRREYVDPDDRIADCGNYRQIVTGKALLELTAEEVYLPLIQEADGEFRDMEAARETLGALISGTSRFMQTGLATSGYQASLDKLEKEFARATDAPIKKPGIDQIIAGARARVGSGTGQTQRIEKDFLR